MSTTTAHSHFAPRSVRRDGGVSSASMSDDIFDRLATYVYQHCGLKLSLAKRTLLEGRIRKRLRVLGLGSFPAYCDYLFSQKGQTSEVGHLIDVVTTHTTDFFREPHHFEYLTQMILPRLFRERKLPTRELRVWSSACSTGEEPYTIAMVLAEHAARVRNFRYSILATDVSAQVLEVACTGIYLEEKVEPVPTLLRTRYLLKSKKQACREVRVVPELRAAVIFHQLNLMEPFRVAAPMDIIFCRNALIYFDHASQEKLVGQFHDSLTLGGYLFVGHSETLSGLPVPFVYEAATIYRRPGRSDE